MLFEAVEFVAGDYPIAAVLPAQIPPLAMLAQGVFVTIYFFGGLFDS
jgi:hypothetical protein